MMMMMMMMPRFNDDFKETKSRQATVPRFCSKRTSTWEKLIEAPQSAGNSEFRIIRMKMMMIEELFHPRRTPRFLTFPGYEREAGLWPAWASARRRRRAAWRGGWWRTGTPCTFGRLERVMQAPTFSGQKPFIDNLDLFDCHRLHLNDCQSGE